MPLLILAGCARAGRYLVFGPTHLFEHHLHKTFGFEELLGHGEHGFDLATGAHQHASAGLLGIGLAYRFYAAREPRSRPAWPHGSGRSTRPPCNKFYVDEVYDWVVVKTTRAAGRCL